MDEISDHELMRWRALFEVQTEEAEAAAKRKPASSDRTFGE